MQKHYTNGTVAPIGTIILNTKMGAYYDKVIVKEVDGEKVAVVIFDEKLHTPMFFELSKCGMDEVLELLNKDTQK